MNKSMSSKAAQLSLGTHNIAQKLKEIDLSTEPFFFQYMPFIEAILLGPRNLMDD